MDMVQVVVPYVRPPSPAAAPFVQLQLWRTNAVFYVFNLDLTTLPSYMAKFPWPRGMAGEPLYIYVCMFMI